MNNAPVEIPVIVKKRWEEELKLNRYTGWRSIAQWCASIAINAEIAVPFSPFADLMATKAKEAHQNMLAAMRGDKHANA